MKILFDNQMFVLQDRGGISRYFSEIISNLRDFGVSCQIPFMISKNIYLEKLHRSHKKRECLDYSKINSHLPKVIQDRRRTLYYIGRLFHPFIRGANYISNIFLLLFGKYEIYHPTYLDVSLIKYVRKDKKIIATIHDMIDELYRPNNIEVISNKKKLIERADKIIAVSENTKKDILKFYDIPEQKICVIYHGTSLSLKGVDEDDIDSKIIDRLPKKYILYVGARLDYKNFMFFCKALTKILLDNADLMIVCIGGGEFSLNETRMLTEMNIFNRFFRFDVTDSTLIHTYKKAELFIYPSMYEGFGIPILEAFSAGCPVATSNRGSLPEIGGNSVEYFDPENKDSMIKAVNVILSNSKRRLDLIKLGFERVKMFSWQNAAKQTLEVYNSALNEK